MRILISSLILLCSMSTGANTKIILHQKQGGDVSVLLKNKPVATYEGSELVIVTQSTILRFALKSIVNVTYEEVTDDIEPVAVASQDVGTSCVYDMNGILVMKVPAGQSVTTSSLPKGIYIVKTSSSTYKIQKR